MSSEISNISGQTWGWMLLVSSLSITGFWAQTASLQWIEASTLSALKALEILFAYSVQIIVMEHNPNDLAFIGSGLVMIAVIMTKQAEKIEKCLDKGCKKRKSMNLSDKIIE